VQAPLRDRRRHDRLRRLGGLQAQVPQGFAEQEPGDTKPVSEAAPMINWDRSASLFGMPLGRQGSRPRFLYNRLWRFPVKPPVGPRGRTGKAVARRSWLEGVPGAIGTSPERMVRNSEL
jgi:hypothetical protein